MVDRKKFDEFSELLEILKDEVSLLEIEVEQNLLEVLLLYLLEVLQINKHINLTAVRDPRKALTLHLSDSLAFLKSILKIDSLTTESHYLDIGTGAGFPGLPISCVCNFNTVLLDSVSKKLKAIDEASRLANINMKRVRLSNQRVEEFAHEHPKSFDLITARAVAESKVLLEYSSPLLAKGSYLIIGKGRLDKIEFEEALKTAEIVGMSFVSRETFELPNCFGHREILTYRKDGTSKVKLPRRIGQAKNNPLV